MANSSLSNAVLTATLLLASGAATAQPSARTDSAADERADVTLRAMRPEEKTVLTHGKMALSYDLQTNKPSGLPPEAVVGAGFVPGIPRLGVPSLRETDASLGVAYFFGLRGDGATPLPSGLAMASTWNDSLVEQSGRMIGGEAKAKGFNVMLAGGVNLMRDPRNGRNFEYFGEDPLLSGRLAGHAIAGIQSNHMIATIKHFALNGQETARKFVDSRISEGAAQESDLLAFRIGMEIGKPGSVMCAYNKVNGESACANDWLLNRVLKRDWGYKGFVMSDWGAVPGVDAALKGLDQQSGAELDAAVYFSDQLAGLAKSDAAYARRLDDMNRRILWAIYDKGLDRFPAQPGGVIDETANAALAEKVAQQGIVLLRNERGVLPLIKSAKRIAVIGGYADSGVLSGGGSSQVHSKGGPAVAVPIGGTSLYSPALLQAYHRSVPLTALKAMSPSTSFAFRDGRYISEAVAQARNADVAIVFATQWTTEGFDQADLSLPNGQDALIDAVTRANPNTVVVLETGGPVLMPWLDQTAAVVQAWYPGVRGGEAIAAVLFGKVNPSGRLPITFPSDVAQLPRLAVDGFEELEPDFFGNPPHDDKPLIANFDIEGSDIGYRWNARNRHKALFPFGFGLSYTTFETGNLAVRKGSASAVIRNTGSREGATVAQLYLLSRGGETKQRLVGYSRVELLAGASKKVTFEIDPRLLADWVRGRWELPAGTYSFALGENAEAMGKPVTVNYKAQSWVEAPLPD